MSSTLSQIVIEVSCSYCRYSVVVVNLNVVVFVVVGAFDDIIVVKVVVIAYLVPMTVGVLIEFDIVVVNVGYRHSR